MVNDPKLIENIIEEINKISSEDLKEMIALVDEQYFLEEFNINASYVIVDNYKVSEELFNYNQIHRKSFFNFLRKNNEETLEAA